MTLRLSTLMILSGLMLAAPVRAQTEDSNQATGGESVNKNGLIEPTSKGSSGAPDAAPAGGGGAGEEADTAGSEAIPNAGGVGTNPGPDVNPYPNANSGTGMVNGGSVNGTGALTSAHPGH